MDDMEKKKKMEEHLHLNEFVTHLINMIEMSDERYSFEFASGGVMEVYDRENDIGYVLHIEEIKYDDDGNAINL